MPDSINLPDRDMIGAPKSGRLPGWVVALVVLVALGLLTWRVILPKYEDWKVNDAEAKKEEAAAAYVNKQRMKPRNIGGLMTATLDPTAAPAPTGITISLDDGKHAVRAEGPYEGLPPHEGTVAERFRKALDALVAAAAKDENLKNAKSLSLSFITASGKTSEKLALPADETRLAKAVQGWVDTLKLERKDYLDSPMGSLPPPGYAVIFSDDHLGSAPLVPIRLLPITEAEAKERLVAFMTKSIEHTRPASHIPNRRHGPASVQLPASSSMAMPGAKPGAAPATAGAKPATPSNMLHITIEAPDGEIEFDVPISPGKDYPTDADVKKGRDKIIEEKASEAAKQINDLNERAKG